MRKFVKLYNTIEEYVADVLMVAAIFLVFISILMRYVFKAAIPWADEVYTIIFAWAMTLGYSVTARDNEHIMIDVADMFIKSKTVLKILDVFSKICTILFSLILCYYGYLAALQQHSMGRVTPTLLIPRYIVYAIIPYTGLVLTIRYVVKLVNIFKNWKNDTAESTVPAEVKEDQL